MAEKLQWKTKNINWALLGDGSFVMRTVSRVFFLMNTSNSNKKEHAVIKRSHNSG